MVDPTHRDRPDTAGGRADDAQRSIFSEKERATLLALAQYSMPPGQRLPGASINCVARFEKLLTAAEPWSVRALKSAIKTLDLAPLLRHRRPLRRLSKTKRDAWLRSWEQRRFLNQHLLKLLLLPLKVLHFDDPEIFKEMGCVYTPDPVQVERPRYMQKVTDLSEFQDSETMEADVVVVGTGAGGAVVANGLAKQGHAVILLEEGSYLTRRDFQGSRVENTRKSYRNLGATASIGNTIIPIPMGRAVGGSTTINSGTCYQAPSWILDQWVHETGMEFFRPDQMAPYYEEVEGVLRVEYAKARYLTGVEQMIARGCDALGYRHGPLRRNAPDCDGQGFCAYGCPTDAKRSTNVSYVPMALERGAYLFTGARVDEILTEGGRAVGVRATGTSGAGRTVHLTIRAKATILSCGTILTPALLMRNKLLSSSRALGRYLTIHPASHVLALFDQDIRGWKGIPQGYCIEEFHKDGILFEGAFTPMEVATMGIPFNGPQFMNIMERFNQMATFGYMIKDSSTGRVRLGPGGSPLIWYNLRRKDLQRIKMATHILWKVFHEAGADRILAPIRGHEDLTDERALKKFMASNLKPRQVDLTAFHPLGTARLGSDPSVSVVDEKHQCHDLPGLYIVDGGNLPGSPSVNPQVTIMALATRAAERIGEQLD